MNNKAVAEFRQSLKGKKIAVLGAGISNRPLIRWLYPYADKIHVFDRLNADDKIMQKTISDFSKSGFDLEWSLGPEYLDNLKGFDIIFRTPNMRPDLPQLLAERERGATISSEMQLFLELCPANITAITGSDGKTTTTTLISLILQQAGKRVFTGGNIGTPLLDQVDMIRADDEVVLELSSFQLMDIKARINVAVITNLNPNHLDFHSDFEEYMNAKKNIIALQTEDDVLVLNYEDLNTRNWAKDTKAKIRYFNTKEYSGAHSYFDGEMITLQSTSDKTAEISLKRDDFLLPGRFNLDNLQAAMLATVDKAGFDDFYAVASTFNGVPHRMEWIRKLDGADWYNSSIDTSPDRSVKTLEALSNQGREVVLIAGGKDKNSVYSKLGRAIVQICRCVVLIGANADLIESAISSASENTELGETEIYHCNTYPDAVKLARDLSKPGDAVILSSAGTSFDFFHHFEERGNLFRDLVLAEAERS